MKTHTYHQLAEMLGEVIGVTPVDDFGQQVVVYRQKDTLKPFYATVLERHDDYNGGALDVLPAANARFCSGLSLAKYLTNTDLNSVEGKDLSELQEECDAQGITFPATLIPLARVVEREKEHQDTDGLVRLRIHRTEANALGNKTLLIDGEADLVDSCWTALEAHMRANHA